MKNLLLLFFVLLCLNCENKQSKENSKASDTNTDKLKPKRSTSKDSLQISKREFPLLNDQNIMDFLLSYGKKNTENKIRMTTDFGSIDILLYEKTRFHRANFIYLTKQGYFNNTQFYRVINNFMIQGGNSDDRKTSRKRGDIGKYLLPNDTKQGYTHHRGVISMPSSDVDNPYKKASPFEFFIVQNPKGEYRLDGGYTVFGKIIKGMNVVDKIAAAQTDEADWPLQNIYIKKVEIIE